MAGKTISAVKPVRRPKVLGQRPKAKVLGQRPKVLARPSPPGARVSARRAQRQIQRTSPSR